MRNPIETTPSRRRFLTAAGAAGLAVALPAALPLTPPFGWSRAGAATPLLTRAIPKTGERIPAVGMGTWITFNVGGVTSLRDLRAEVLREFFRWGGGMIDSSPMYGSSEEVLGYAFKRIGVDDRLFSATKIWTDSPLEGVSQMADSFSLWGLARFDLFQVHNLVNWEEHLPMLVERKEQGLVRYVGLTTSHGWRHDEMLSLMRRDDVDFVQFTHNIVDREAEDRLLPMAADRGIGVIVNRPFQRGALTQRLEGEPLPGWAAEYGIETWAQFLLKFIVSHPAVTCAIPATTRVDHMAENMGAMAGPLPDAKTRRRMIDYVESL
ncbi:MAG: aldo/keto reductase [Alphaproteobacteria bacterium]|nr:aldo/keto reductase [Alphaproteobacteria bacterium]